MAKYKDPEIINLYLDESGRSFIGDPEYQFFLMTAVIITPSQGEFADLLFQQWRNKYIKNPNKAAHAVDLFEERKDDYKKHELCMSRNFSKAVSDLQDILDHLEFESKVFYVDVSKLRTIKGIRKPPERLKLDATNIEKREHSKLKKEFDEHLEKTINKRDRYLPLSLSLQSCFNLYAETLSEGEDKKGYINYESQSTSDKFFLEIFHQSNNPGYRHGETIYKYGDNIIGINLHTKGSLDGGIQFSDLISYITCQNLRSIHSRKELKDICPNSLKQIRKLWMFLRDKKQIKYIDVTTQIYEGKMKKASTQASLL